MKYAMVADVKREIQKAYGIEHPDEGVALRGSFLIDANGIVRHRVVNDLPLGRNYRRNAAYGRRAAVPRRAR